MTALFTTTPRIAAKLARCAAIAAVQRERTNLQDAPLTWEDRLILIAQEGALFQSGKRQLLSFWFNLNT